MRHNRNISKLVTSNRRINEKNVLLICQPLYGLFREYATKLGQEKFGKGSIISGKRVNMQ